MPLDLYLGSRYVKGARGPDAFDCWGMTAAARAELFPDRAPLPALSDVCHSDVRAITRAAESVPLQFRLRECQAAPGAIASAWRASLCVHVGLVIEADGRLVVLETDRPKGPCLTSLRTFTTRFSRVLFYDDQDISKPVARPSA